MKKIMLVVAMCLMLVGCGKQTALDITKENYEKYGYNYTRMELNKMIDSDKYDFDDLRSANEFLANAEHGMTIEEINKEMSGNK